METTTTLRVGTPVTKGFFSDSQAGKVLLVINDKKIVVGFYDYPSYGEDRVVDVNYERISNDYPVEVWTMRKSGNWRKEGCPDKWGECRLSFGKAHSYRSLDY